jgi:molybdopterin synthase sulfur carrier subunit
VQELIENLEKSYSGLRDRICDETGNIRRFINVYVNEEDIRFLQGTSTPLKAGDLVSIVPAIAGGSGDARRLAPEVAVLGVEHRVSRQQSLPRAAATRTDAGTSEQA